MLKEVGCLPMVKPDAASHSGFRHVRRRTSLVLIVGGYSFCFPRGGKGDLTWDVREWETRRCHLRVRRRYSWSRPFELRWILNTESEMMNSASRKRVLVTRE